LENNITLEVFTSKKQTNITNDGEREFDLIEQSISVKSDFSSLESFNLDNKKYYMQYVGKNLLGAHLIRIATTKNRKYPDLNKKTAVLQPSLNEGSFELDGYTVDYNIKEGKRRSAKIYLNKAK